MTMPNRVTTASEANVGGDIFRLCLAVLALFGCYWLIVDSARGGFARLLCTASIISSQVEPADRAVSWAPRDPETHYTRALSLINAERLDDALGELQMATRLRPHHYYEWLDLGVTLDRLGDSVAAEAAIRQSIRLAPTFAQPHWQLGNLLYRARKYPEAFEELRMGARSNPNLREGLLRLAWGAADEDVSKLVEWVEPEGKKDHFMIGRLLASAGQGAEAAKQVRLGGVASDEDDRNILRATILQLIAHKQFSSALDVWKTIHSVSTGDAGNGQIINGDFLDPVVREDVGFGWQISNIPNVSVAIDVRGPADGSRSLRVDFNGEVPRAQVVNQLVLLQPESRYLLRFMAKGEDVVSGGLPLIVASDIDSGPAQVLGQSATLGAGGDGWTPYQFEFSTLKSTAVVFSLQRQQCSQNQCPIFGKLWLSHFSLIKL